MKKERHKLGKVRVFHDADGWVELQSVRLKHHDTERNLENVRREKSIMIL